MTVPAGPTATLPAVVLATRNSGKVREFRRLLQRALDVRILPDGIILPEETGVTFAENARLKAHAVFAALQGTFGVMADDSGLQVEALGGAPGVHSARYAGPDAGDAENVERLLAELEGREDREARFVCTLCLLLPHVQPAPEGGRPEAAREFVVEGRLEGTITRAARGTDGFGYDPVFRPKGWDQTLAQARPAAKDGVSHRGVAVGALLTRLRRDGVVSNGL